GAIAMTLQADLVLVLSLIAITPRIALSARRRDTTDSEKRRLQRWRHRESRVVFACVRIMAIVARCVTRRTDQRRLVRIVPRLRRASARVLISLAGERGQNVLACGGQRRREQNIRGGIPVMTLETDSVGVALHQARSVVRRMRTVAGIAAVIGGSAVAGMRAE